MSARCAAQPLRLESHRSSHGMQGCLRTGPARLMVVGARAGPVTCMASYNVLRPASSHSALLQSRAKLQPCRLRRPRSRRLTVAPKAMVNVDFASPSLVLGGLLIGCGIVLLQMRNMQTSVSRDADIVVAAMVSIVGSTLIFQGWRLDPLLLLCQALTTSVAVWYGIETFRLRSKEEEQQQQQQGMLPPGSDSWGFGAPGSPMQQQQQGGMLPPQQQQQQVPGGMEKLMGTFMGGAGQAAQPQQAGYGQRGRSPSPGPYLPPGQEQPGYPWQGSAAASPIMVSYGQQEVPAQQPMEALLPGQAELPAASWQYDAGPMAGGQYPANTPTQYGGYYDSTDGGPSGPYYGYSQQQPYAEYDASAQYGTGSGYYGASQQGSSAPQEATYEASAQGAFTQQWQGTSSSGYAAGLPGPPPAVPGGYMDGPQEASSRPAGGPGSSSSSPAASPLKHMVVEKVDDWE